MSDDKSKEIKELKKEMARLKDENESLWFILDEMKKSNISNPEYSEHFEKAFSKLRHQNKMLSKKVAKA